MRKRRGWRGWECGWRGVAGPYVIGVAWELVVGRRTGNPLGRSGHPREIGALAVYLASDDAAWTTGQAFTVDGGFTAR